MSLVGTRPILQDELQKYELHHRARIAIKPGITGIYNMAKRIGYNFPNLISSSAYIRGTWNYMERTSRLV